LIEDCIRSDVSANLCKTVADSLQQHRILLIIEFAPCFALTLFWRPASFLAGAGGTAFGPRRNGTSK
jgi:hypothetical protein